MNLEQLLIDKVVEGVNKIYGASLDPSVVTIQETRKEFAGDLTVVVFPLIKVSKKGPEQTGADLGTYLQQEISFVSGFNVVKGFLNIELTDRFWIDDFLTVKKSSEKKSDTPVMVEYSSPNTNKPLHLGHIRNNLLGYAVAEILKASGKNVVKANLINDRGIHICKSMLAWQKWGNGETPDSAMLKGDHLVGKYYVLFDKEYKKEIETLMTSGTSEEDAKKQAPLIKEAQSMLLKWEEGDKEVMELWNMMNTWVYAGFNATYKSLGVDFDKFYYESNTYLSGKAIVDEGLKKGVFYKKDDGSVWVDLTEDGLDHKLLLRGDGTSVYITQDLGTAKQRYDEHSLEKLIYVVGNEQDYHFKVLQLILKKLGWNWADGIYHLSYGMVDLPSGKMKSREGTVVDADDLIEQMISSAKTLSEELGKMDDFTEEEAEALYRTIGLGALKYFILKVDPKKRMLFDPKESIDFNGHTGPFIQYTYARIRSILRKAGKNVNELKVGLDVNSLTILDKEKSLLKTVYKYPQIVDEAAEGYSPAIVANYVYELAKQYNQFYHETPILIEEDKNKLSFRLILSDSVSKTIKTAMTLLGIEVPERM